MFPLGRKLRVTVCGEEEPLPIYMNWGNTTPPKIQGNATDKGHLNWIELTSFQFGVYRPPRVGSQDNRKPNNTTDVTLTKSRDDASAPLFREVASGHPETVIVDLKQGDHLLSMRLSETIISNYSVSGDQESITLNFSKLEWGGAPGVTPHSTTPPLPSQGWDSL